jgi:hypothetical protein
MTVHSSDRAHAGVAGATPPPGKAPAAWDCSMAALRLHPLAVAGDRRRAVLGSALHRLRDQFRRAAAQPRSADPGPARSASEPR